MQPYRILDIDVTTGKYSSYVLPNELVRKYLGGTGINAKILLDEVDEDVNPLGPDNLLIFGVGALVGTTFPCSGRFTVTTKSPLTGIYGDSNAGGFFGVYLARLGYRHLILRGKNDFPSYLVLEEHQEPKLLPADEIWGKDIIETDRMLLQKHGPCETARIGPAGENLVLYANIVSSRSRLSYHGRGGVGAVMGSKNIKAIVITKPATPIDKGCDDFQLLVKRYRSKIKQSSGCEYRAKNGTLNIMTAYNMYEAVWQDNYQSPVIEEKASQLEPGPFLEKYFTGKKTGCQNCSMACTLHWQINEGPHMGRKGEKVEFGHTFPLGANLGCFQFDDVLYLSDLSNLLGLDSMELGFSMGFFSECAKRNILPDGLKSEAVEFGDAQSYGKLIEKIANRRGVGNILADGVKRASQFFGKQSQAFGFHYKGQAYRTEKNQSWLLGFAVSPRGGDHLKSMAFTTFAFGTPHAMKYTRLEIPDSDTYIMESPVAKGRFVWWHENYKTIVDCLGVCIFPLINLFLNGEAQVSDLVKLYNAATGLNLSKNEIWTAGERVFQLMKVFNAILGINRKDDTLIRRGTDDNNSASPNSNIDLDAPGMLDEYYFYRGCTKEGRPTFSRLKEVGLEELIAGLVDKKIIDREENAAIRGHQLKD